VPALAALVTIQADELVAAGATPGPELAAKLLTLRQLSGGFIVTSLVWAGMVAALVDRRLGQAAGWCLAAAGLALCGVIHSPFPDGRMFLPWSIGPLPAAYAVLALLFAGWQVWLRGRARNSDVTGDTRYVPEHRT
jgi:AGZA family xanthine/uracil permease-like MFS transporter